MLTIIAIIILLILAAAFMLMPGVVATIASDRDPLDVPKARLRIMRLVGLVIFTCAVVLTMTWSAS